MADEDTQVAPSGGNKTIMIVVVVLLIAVVAIVVLAKKPSTEEQQVAAPTQGASAPTDAMQGETKDQSVGTNVAVTGKNFAFDPKEIRVKKGEKVTLVFTSEGGIHDWVVDEFNAATKQISSGESETITFTPTKAGTFEYYCSVGNHRAMGMTGKLIVE
jgi:plastocyanin